MTTGSGPRQESQKEKQKISSNGNNSKEHGAADFENKHSGAHERSQMGLPGERPGPVGANFSQSTTLDRGVVNDMKYRLVLKDDFAEDPPHGVIFVNKNVQNQDLTFKVKGVKGEILEESILIPALPENDTLDIQKLITYKAEILQALQDREQLVTGKIDALKAQEKQALQASIKIAIAAGLEKENSLRLFRNQEELDQVDFDKKLKKRLENSKTMDGVMTPALLGNVEHSNAGRIQSLAGYSMEALAIKMNMELLFFFIKLIWAPTGGYASALKQYELYAQKYPESKYDAQQLYNYTTDSKGNFKLDITDPVTQEKDKTLDVILANGYLPKPSVLDQIREATQNYVIEQMGVDIYENITIAKKHFHCQSEKPAHQQDQDNDLEGAVLSRRKPPLPRGSV